MGTLLQKITRKTAAYLELDTPGSTLLLFFRMVLFLLLIFVKDQYYQILFMIIIVTPGLFFRKMAFNKYYWLLFAILFATIYLFLDFFFYIPNHKHIYAYALGAITLGLFAFTDIDELTHFLKKQSRYIIGLCFLLATVGKFLAPEFIDGYFFEFTAGTDHRFFGFSSILGGIPPEALEQNRIWLDHLITTTRVSDTFILNGASSLTLVAYMLTYWTIFIEGMIAISFCVPSAWKLSKYRDWFLVIFIITTYPIATVAGFAVILTTLGFMQSLNEGKLTPFSLFYLLVFIFLPVIELPFSNLRYLF